MFCNPARPAPKALKVASQPCEHEQYVRGWWLPEQAFWKAIASGPAIGQRKPYTNWLVVKEPNLNYHILE